MSADLAELSSVERRLSESLPSVRGIVDEAVEGRIYRQYEQVARAYGDLAAGGVAEATKRLVFLWWYSVAEPSYLSGIGRFPDDLSKQTVAMLRSVAAAGIDEEFKRMLAWYYTITDWYFEDLVPELVETFARFAATTRGPDGSTDLSVVDTASDRGQMGAYFRAMRESQSG